MQILQARPEVRVHDARALYILRPSTEIAMRQADASAEWATAQMQYLLHVAQHSARAQALFYNVLHKIGNGVLTPEAIHRTSSDLSSAAGPSHAAELARLGARFIGRLLLLTGQESEPPRFDSTNPVAWLVQIADDMDASNRRVVERYQADLESVASGALTPVELQSRLVEDTTRQSVERLHQMRLAYFDFLESVSDLSAAFERDFLDRLLGGAGGTSSGQVELRAPLGDRAVAELMVENTRGGPVVVRVAVTDVRRADGIGPAFDPAITIDPDGLMLEPGSTAAVRVSLVMDPQHFTADVRYVGTVQLLRHGDGRLDLPLQLLASDPTAAVSSRFRS
jgi:hypothetical protein